MSTTTVSYRSTVRDAELAAVRRREAEARAAAREARRRAEEERRRQAEQRQRDEAARRQEEERRRRIERLNQDVSAQEGRYQRLVERLDNATRRLPDLAITAPRLASVSDSLAKDPDRLEAYVTQLTGDVERFSRQLDDAIAEAERLLQRRLAKAAAWRRATDLKQRIELLSQESRDMAALLKENLGLPVLPAQPGVDAELEPVEAYQQALQACCDTLISRHAGLRARVRSKDNAIRIAGASVHTGSAQESLARYAEAQRAQVIAELRAHRDKQLAQAGLRLNELPPDVRNLVDAALESDLQKDYRSSISRWIAREKQRREGVARALELMQQAPDLIHDDGNLSSRWASLAAQLQRIAGGLEEINPSVEREYQQLRADAARLVNTAFTRADWVQAMCEQGFEVLEREDGQGLLVVDLDQPEIWLEVTETEMPEGFGATLELKTDAQMLAGEADITQAVCAKLAEVAGRGAPEVNTEAEEIERDDYIKRARRPAMAKKTFAQTL